MLKYNYLFILTFVLIFFLPSCGGSSRENSGGESLVEEAQKEDSRMELLERITVNLPVEIRNTILADIEGFMEQISRVIDSPSDLFLLADKQHFLGSDYAPEDIMMLTDYPELSLSRNNHSLRKILIPDLLRMVESARMEGLKLLISSTYRTYEYQDKLFKWNVEQNGLETAERESARPGTSQHQLGTTLDFGTITDEYAFTAAGKWLLENAWEYGFSLSYPDGYEDLTGYRYEGWHFRYIGPAAAKLQRDYFDDIQYYLLSFLNEYREELKNFL